MSAVSTNRNRALVRAIRATISAMAVGAVSPGVWAQEQQGQEGLEEIVVTGSRIAGINVAETTPVVTIGSERIGISGTVSIENLLNEQPQFRPSDTSFSNNPGIGVSTIDLRGLNDLERGATRTLVLVNGRRYTIYGANQATDVSTIPAALIERVEIVSGGASAVYGSDAIAGVVNFILKDDFEGFQADVLVRADRHGDSFTRDYTVTAGGNFADDRGNATLSINYFNRDPLLASERAFANPALGDGVDEEGNPVLVEQGSSFNATGRFSGFPTGDALGDFPELADALEAAGLGNVGGAGFTFNDEGTNAHPFMSPEDTYNFAPLNYVRIPTERWSINSMADYEIFDSVTAYMAGNFTNTKASTQLAPTPLPGLFEFQVDNPFLSPEMQDVFTELDAIDDNPGDGRTSLAVARRLVELNPRRVNNSRSSWRAVVGLEGDLGSFSEDFFRDMRFDLYYLYTRTENNQNVSGNVDTGLIQQALLVTPNGSACLDENLGCAPLNIFGTNISPDAADFIEVATKNDETATLQVAQGVLTGDLFSLPAGPVGSSFGVEFRSTSASFNPDALLASGRAIGKDTFPPTEGSYETWEVFGEIRVPLLSDMSLVESLNANAGFRWSDVDLPNVGSVWSYLAGADWRINQQIVLRTQYQRAVRVPNVDELFAGESRFDTGGVDPCFEPEAAEDSELRDLCIATGVPPELVADPGLREISSPTGRIGGNENLIPESADTWTFGTIVTPEAVPGLSVTADYFRIELSDAVAELAGSAQGVFNFCYEVIRNVDSEFCRAIHRNASGVAGIPGGFVEISKANIGGITTSGIDLTVSYDFDLGWGLFDGGSNVNLVMAGTWLNEFKEVPVEENPAENYDCAGKFGITCGQPRPELKVASRGTWRTGPLTLSLQHRFLGSVEDDRIELSGTDPATLPVPEVEAQHYVDLSVRYRLMEDINILAGVSNVFDNSPPVLGDAAQQNNTFPGTYDSIGTEFFLGTQVRF